MNNWPEYLIFDINEIAITLYSAGMYDSSGVIQISELNYELDDIIDNLVYCAVHRVHFFSLLNDYVNKVRERESRMGEDYRAASLARAISIVGYKFFNLLNELKLYDDAGKMHYAYSGRIGSMSVILTRFR